MIAPAHSLASAEGFGHTRHRFINRLQHIEAASHNHGAIGVGKDQGLFRRHVKTLRLGIILNIP